MLAQGQIVGHRFDADPVFRRIGRGQHQGRPVFISRQGVGRLAVHQRNDQGARRVPHLDLDERQVGLAELLVEGLAVYLSDGHFKKEPLLQRAAELINLGWYLPLTQLADSFYTSQHEIGYLEGGALVQFMVTRYGWQAFNDFYRDIHPHPSGENSRALDQALQNHFGLTLEQLEGRFKTVLFRQHTNPDMHDDLFFTVAYYDAVRRYQELLDPSAYFLTAWLPAGDQMRQRGIVADYLRRPSTPENLAIEELLVEVDKQLRTGNYYEAEKALLKVNDKLAQTQDNVLVGSAVPFLFQRTDIGLE